MDKSKSLEKVRRLARKYKKRQTKRGKVITGPYWTGYYQENGKSVEVYIGRELPESLRWLVKRRIKRPGYQNYTWPERKARTAKR